MKGISKMYNSSRSSNTKRPTKGNKKGISEREHRLLGMNKIILQLKFLKYFFLIGNKSFLTKESSQIYTKKFFF
jgi:hypothetical protein